MATAVAVTNLILGTAYTSYGVLTILDMKRGWRTDGFSHFGAAWIAMAFTCGPHHLFHGIHGAFEGRAGGALDLLAVGVGLPAGLIWLYLRIEAYIGGRGDRFIEGTPPWVAAIPTIAAVYMTLLGTGFVSASTDSMSLTSIGSANVILVALYMMIGYYLLRTQLRNRHPFGGWSLSGLSLSVVFPTCALMHGVFIFYSATGRYEHDVHGFWIDWLSVPAATYFLWVVRSLYRGSLRDWNKTGSGDVSPKLVEVG